MEASRKFAPDSAFPDNPDSVDSIEHVLTVEHHDAEVQRAEQRLREARLAAFRQHGADYLREVPDIPVSERRPSTEQWQELTDLLTSELEGRLRYEKALELAHDLHVNDLVGALTEVLYDQTDAWNDTKALSTDREIRESEFMGFQVALGNNRKVLVSATAGKIEEIILWPAERFIGGDGSARAHLVRYRVVPTQYAAKGQERLHRLKRQDVVMIRPAEKREEHTEFGRFEDVSQGEVRLLRSMLRYGKSQPYTVSPLRLGGFLPEAPKRPLPE